jgi:Domain of unknown function (DUF4388)
MTKSTANLETFDFLELLMMLGDTGRTGVLRVAQPWRTDGNLFEAWMDDGRLRSLTFGTLSGVPALTALISDPRGQFNFEEGLTHPEPRLNLAVEAAALDALNQLPVPELVLRGPARLVHPDRVYRMPWSLRQANILAEVEQGRPLRELAEEQDALELLSRLARLGLLSARKSRVARLVLGVTYDVARVAVIDDTILKRWRDDLGRHISHIVLRDPAGHQYTFLVRGGATAGTQLLLPPELMTRSRLNAGESVLVQPAILATDSTYT